MSETTSSSEQKSGVLTETSNRVKTRVNEVVGPHVEQPLKRAQEKFEQLKSEYPSAAPTLESAEKTINDLGDKVSKAATKVVETGDSVIDNNIVAPMEKVKGIVEKEADREEVKKAKKAGHDFFISILALFITYANRVVDFAHDSAEKNLPANRTGEELISVKKMEQPGLKDKTYGTAAKTVNRLYGFFLDKSSLSGKLVNFRNTESFKDYVTPICCLACIFIIGAGRYLLQLGTTYRGPMKDTVHRLANFALAVTNFKRAATPEEAKSELQANTESATESFKTESTSN
eukprot:Plantae.Rhodophyta-Purpureofilum_apyrenoidigerum.ctg24849.p2 GENE.Plantae.Rhodophyta-Purpureofilum_apyrenoidigerum.ctg24849~~Plantae.Rhodophyta-Purpureofilum_apyrenoidigerum.ctg24849.p2  ORF type:complete len:289 (-),score=84.90 Plantae.Rhodophyta-Purpureofilum_apyrenoidigerum.ctg24849:1207-2073(-)